MIHVKGLSLSYGILPVLKDINLEIRQGEFVLITGPSGCGKSTLAYALSGLLPHSIPAQFTGQVVIGGLDTQTHPLREIVQQAGIVLQNPSSQLFHLRVEDEVAFGPRNLGLSEYLHKKTRQKMLASNHNGLCMHLLSNSIHKGFREASLFPGKPYSPRRVVHPALACGFRQNGSEFLIDLVTSYLLHMLLATSFRVIFHSPDRVRKEGMLK